METVAIPGLTELETLIGNIFFPDAYSRLLAMRAEGSRLVHYTSAEVGMSIIQNSAVWMRNTMTMNDFSEVEHGLECINAAWDSVEGRRLHAAVDAIHPGTAEATQEQFNLWLPDMRADTYIACVSEHPPSEDGHGRLSMWRAYGGRSGVALVMNTTPFAAASNKLKAYSSPVVYTSGEDIKARLGAMAAKIAEAAPILSKLTADDLRDNLWTALRFGTLCTKHPAFQEEREWRVIYSPNLERSPVIEPVVKAVRGIPQIVQMLPLRDDPDNGLHQADVAKLIHRVIIGPTEDALAIYAAYVQLLMDAGVEDARERVWISGIPLRQF